MMAPASSSVIRLRAENPGVIASSPCGPAAAKPDLASRLSAADMASQGQSGHLSPDKCRVMPKCCTKIGASAASKRAPQLRIFGRGHPVRHQACGSTTTALQLGLREHFGELRLIARCQQYQAIQHATDSGAARRQAIALARKPRELQGRIVVVLEEGETGTGLGASCPAEQRDRTELA